MSGRPLRGGAAATLVTLCHLLTSCTGTDAEAEAVEVARQAALMGTTLTVRVIAEDRASAVAGTEAVLDEVARVERLVSSWDSTTALGRLNRAPVGEPVSVDPELLDLLVRADRLADTVGRAFEPGVGPLVDAWDLRGEGRTPSPAERTRALEAVRAGFDFDPAAGTAVRRHEDAWIDAGGFGKGAGLEAAARRLEELGVVGALLDFGGQALTRGHRADGGAWRIGVAHPALRARSVAELRLGPGLSAATSGGSERPGHLLDPRDGNRLPAWGSVTVVARDPVYADVLSTALFVLGTGAALDWAEHRDDVGVLVLEDREDGLRARWTPAMEEWLDTASVGARRPDTTGSRDGAAARETIDRIL